MTIDPPEAVFRRVERDGLQDETFETRQFAGLQYNCVAVLQDSSLLRRRVTERVGFFVTSLRTWRGFRNFVERNGRRHSFQGLSGEPGFICESDVYITKFVH